MTAGSGANEHSACPVRHTLLLSFLMLWLATLAPASGHNSDVSHRKWLASDGQAGDLFGYSVSLSGRTAVIGAHQTDTQQGIDAGAVYVFREHQGCWLEEAKLTASDGAPGDMFGGMTAIEDSTLIVGVIRSDDPQRGEDSGAAYVFERQGESWQEHIKLTASDGAAGDGFGWALDVAGDTLVIGAPKADVHGPDSGAVYVFEDIDGQWQQTAKLTAQDAAPGDLFGISVAISNDTILVGADLHDTSEADAGAAYVFIRQGAHWIQQAKLLSDDGQSTDIFGVRVALDGDVALISARRDDLEGVGVDAGSAYVFERTGSNWKQTTKLTAPDAKADDRFGRSVAISGNTLLIGAMLHDETAENAGAAYVYRRNADDWIFSHQLTADDGASQDRFGWAVALDGETALIAANGHDAGGADAGAVYLFNHQEAISTCSR